MAYVLEGGHTCVGSGRRRESQAAEAWVRPTLVLPGGGLITGCLWGFGQKNPGLSTGLQQCKDAGITCGIRVCVVEMTDQR